MNRPPLRTKSKIDEVECWIQIDEEDQIKDQIDRKFWILSNSRDMFKDKFEIIDCKYLLGIKIFIILKCAFQFRT